MRPNRYRAGMVQPDGCLESRAILPWFASGKPGAAPNGLWPESFTMAYARITCITKSHPQGGHEHITHVGNPQGNWNWTVEAVIQSIDAGTNTFYVQDDSTGKRADVGVVRPQGRKPYLRTYADGVWTDNLLSLTICPWQAAA